MDKMDPVVAFIYIYALTPRLWPNVHTPGRCADLREAIFTNGSSIGFLYATPGAARPLVSVEEVNAFLRKHLI